MVYCKIQTCPTSKLYTISIAQLPFLDYFVDRFFAVSNNHPQGLKEFFGCE